MSGGSAESAGAKRPFTDDQLFARGPQPTYAGAALKQVAFPLGGIGAGCISLAGSGALVDWEIFNRPNKGFRPAFALLSLHAREEGGDPVFRVLEGRLQPPYEGSPGDTRFPAWSQGTGPSPSYAPGLLRMARCSFQGEFPFATVSLSDDAVPVDVSIEAWSPFIPGDSDASSLPVAILEITLHNPGDRAVNATVLLCSENAVGWPDIGGAVNEWMDESGVRGIVMRNPAHASDSPRHGSIAMLTPHEDVTWELHREVAHHFQVFEELVDGFGRTGELPGGTECPPASGASGPVGKLGMKVRLEPGEERTVPLVLSWLMPNFEKYWGASQGAVWQTWHGGRWEDARAVGRETIDRLDELRDRTARFRDEFFASTLPTYVLDAISSQMSTLRSPTVTRLPDGALYGWEGCHATAGCCEGSCSHVWAYAQTMAYLFPDLERSMREIEFRSGLRADDGHMQFRIPLPPDAEADHAFHAAIDGQMGEVLRTFREWRISGDDAWMEALWPDVKLALEYAWEAWDTDRDGMLDGAHHNTLDIEFHGPNTMCGSMYLAALRAGAEMARHCGDEQAAAECERIAASGRRLSDEQLFNGEYYEQIITDPEAQFQFGTGCIIDQVLGQWHAEMYGLGEILDPEHVRSALAAVFRHNFQTDFFGHQNACRVYALNDDMGTVICTWPRGGKPDAPVRYSHECMCGFEYQVGAHMIYGGMLREGLSVAKAIRDRFDGIKRNPFNEFECGNHYARSMANYAYLLALAGFSYDARDNTLSIAPRIFSEDFRCFFAVEGAWGSVHHERGDGGTVVTVACEEGALRVGRLIAGEREIEVHGVTEPDRPLRVRLS